MMRLIRFSADYGRNGYLFGLIALVGDEANAQWDTMITEKTYVYFGEVLGKHSDVGGSIEVDDYTVITDDVERVTKVMEGFYGAAFQNGSYTLSGYNPLEYIPLEYINQE